MEIISFVILHYKDWGVTDLSVQSILKMEHQERIRIVIVDNDIEEINEKRREAQKYYKKYNNVIVLSMYENGGFSYANNQGYIFSKEKLGADFIIILNNDIEFIQADFIKQLDKIYRQKPCHILGPDIIKNSTGEHQNPVADRVRTRQEAEYTVKMNSIALKFYAILYPFLYWQNKYSEKCQTKKRKMNANYFRTKHEDVVPFGACLIFMPEFVKKEEIAFAPETPFYYEEYILAYRCKRKGYRILYDPTLKVLHESGKTTKKSLKNERKRLRFVMEKTLESCKIYLDMIKK